MLDLSTEQTYAPIILVKEAPGAIAAAAVTRVLGRFPNALSLVEVVSTRPLRDEHEASLRRFASRELFEALLAEDIAVAEASHDGHGSAILRLNANEVLTGDRRTFGIALGDEALEASLRAAGYEVHGYVVAAAGTRSPAWDADRLAEFVFGLLDPDDDGLDADAEIKDEDIPADPFFDAPAP